MSMRQDGLGADGTEISGRRVLFHLFGPVGFSGWGTTTLRLDGGWLVEESTGWFGRKKRVLPLAGVEGFQFVTRGNRLLLVLGILLTPVFGIGLLLLGAWFFIRYRFFTIRHQHGSLSLRQWGDLPAYEEFLARLMRLTRQFQRKKRCEAIRHSQHHAI